ncbi:efflux RND transporter periplasmic adaptor subunit [Thalassobaculum sp. OXR-137]|uniref:efflux RND transporter periplasmic adaptor subunit n=1 Tax=Thalassobaculum sp. OXR-137 TaxID=3100173 RepID=UPI002AC9BA6C|nr:efflux RND transporter periplasmic adaptor subunit [Thalassobaculum sp. OXR-137]WPZ35332.1 efflux RND transporter periplasmic adaptor subunit [Thalassobaculum sp. OXR-137]
MSPSLSEETATAAEPAPSVQAPPAIPVSVATVEAQDLVGWKEFAGRLEAVERVDVRSRVAGQVLAVHFREGSLVQAGDLLVTIDPEPFAAEVARAEAQTTAARARLSFTKKEHDRAQQLVKTRTLPIREGDSRANAYREAQANHQAAEADLRKAKLDLGYTEIRAPVSGRVGEILVDVGNLVPAGASAPALTTLVSVDPIYASFEADEQVVLQAIRDLGTGGVRDVSRIPVEMAPTFEGQEPIRGHLQFIDNTVNAASGTIHVRAQFDNPDGMLIPGQFARLRMGTAGTARSLLITDRAVGIDQGKKFVLVVDETDTVAYREVTLGPNVGRLRIVTSGLAAGERIVVNGLQRVRPGARVAAETVAMTPDLPMETASN